MRTVLFVLGGLAAAAFLFIYLPFRPWLSEDYGPDDSDDPGEDVDDADKPSAVCTKPHDGPCALARWNDGPLVCVVPLHAEPSRNGDA